ncbi:hypothetical protein DFH07DRAFT_959682 [Mycena maculata]|uniref:Uncharacterized protein n=1 Tax=Mycena maculata TaxID=230809 RepID=A0AAD7J0U3_9AGAR|nr:hypothetical protein DFH07DRAFT_959682 [Mycena maculata]
MNLGHGVIAPSDLVVPRAIGSRYAERLRLERLTSRTMSMSLSLGDAYDLYHDARGYLADISVGLEDALSNIGPVRTERDEREAAYPSLYAYASREEARKVKARARYRERIDQESAAFGKALALRAAEAKKNTPPSPPSGATRIRSRAALLELLSGSRTEREQPLEHSDPFIGEARPLQLTTDRDHQMCGICKNVKSQPVSCVTFSLF